MSDSMMCCPLTGTSGEGPDWDTFTEDRPTAGKNLRCGECSEIIPKGATYERHHGRWDGRWKTHRTCLSCVEIRTHFACDGWIYGQLWEDLEANFFPDMKAGGPCMEGLSPEAKRRIIDARIAWYEAEGEWDDEIWTDWAKRKVELGLVPAVPR